MSDEKSAGNNPANQGNSNPNKGSGKNNRRRSSRNRRRGRRPEESSATRESSTQSNAPSAPKAAEAEKSVRDNRDRRRRRRMRSKQRGQSETPSPVVESTLKDLPPLVPAFVYTHVLRPSMRDSFEFRTEHFSKVTRKMEDFHIDLSPLYPEGGDEIKGVGYMPPGDREVFDDTDDDADGDAGDEPYEDLDWDSEESADAARLEGAIADEFYDDLGDTVDEPGDESAPEDDSDAEDLR